MRRCHGMERRLAQLHDDEPHRRAAQSALRRLALDRHGHGDRAAAQRTFRRTRTAGARNTRALRRRRLRHHATTRRSPSPRNRTRRHLFANTTPARQPGSGTRIPPSMAPVAELRVAREQRRPPHLELAQHRAPVATTRTSRIVGTAMTPADAAVDYVVQRARLNGGYRPIRWQVELPSLTDRQRTSPSACCRTTARATRMFFGLHRRVRTVSRTRAACCARAMAVHRCERDRPATGSLQR